MEWMQTSTKTPTQEAVRESGASGTIRSGVEGRQRTHAITICVTEILSSTPLHPPILFISKEISPLSTLASEQLGRELGREPEAAPSPRVNWLGDNHSDMERNKQLWRRYSIYLLVLKKP